MIKGTYETEEHDSGGTKWIAIRARGAEWSWLTPQEAVELARYWLNSHSDTAEPAATA